ncbi:MAG: site-specific integrase [Methanobrevibacter sp.]|nr:site-specific integrase [Methanobrevibacter sp.]
MNMNNQEIIDNFAVTRKLSHNTKRRYKLILNRYSEFNNMTLQELLDEADDEEEQRIRRKKRKIKDRLIKFRTYVYDKYMVATAKSNMDVILTFYRHFEIEIPTLPPVSTKNTNENPPLRYDDLLTKKILRQVVDQSTPLVRAIVLFSISSGCANAEVMSLTIQDFIDATSNTTSRYHNSNNIYEVIELLIDRDDLVPTFYLKRRKTNKYYYTFCSPEATHAILSYLASARRKLVPEDKLFKIHPNALLRILSEMNDELGLGRKGTYKRLRTHMFRKFHASNLKKDGMSMEDINAIQGKGKHPINEPYFFDSPEHLKEEYVKHLDVITIKGTVNSLNLKSKEYHLLEQELEKRNQEYDSLKGRISNIEKAISNSMSADELELIDKYI